MMFATEALIEGLQTGEKIRTFWKTRWGAKSDFDKGAERIVYSFFNTQGFGIHNSAPVGSDMFFETKDAFIHIDLKTVKAETNIRDHNNKCNIGPNQTSYKGPYKVKNKIRKWAPNLPPTYTVGTKTKPCLTYFITILYEKHNLNILNINILCMPNGILRKHYKARPLSAGKNPKETEARFRWSNCMDFELLKDKPKRIRVIHYDDKNNQHYKKSLKLIKRLYDSENQRSTK
ncbi:MAG: hypothetical protein RI100_07420 [Nitrosarchaeum sp.]|uniref:hypothetical protein n=1 Tax=Nitrosarchaeum sp. TaxID=2026886 RepID=UPI002DE8088A|nr:hypothetical protein [Nitrosarchaeum sp.]